MIKKKFENFVKYALGLKWANQETCAVVFHGDM